MTRKPDRRHSPGGLVLFLAGALLTGCGGGGGTADPGQVVTTHPDAQYGFVLTRKQGAQGRWVYMIYLNDRTHVEVDSWRSDIETGDCVAVAQRSGGVWFEKAPGDRCP